MPGHFVFDPFAGTGSILVAAAVFGAAVAGADIDIRVIAHGKAAERGGGRLDIYTNFEQYGMGGRLAGLLRMDNHRHALRPGLEGMFHAIIGDPPYGVRAGGRKSMPKEVRAGGNATGGRCGCACGRRTDAGVWDSKVGRGLKDVFQRFKDGFRIQ
eukprot:26529-Chlamydomonas_euryale.AAC.3